jgi:para-nitrobenzyl esterase
MQPPDDDPRWYSSEEGRLYQGIAVPWNRFSEDCLVLNIWTPELGASAKRPVMVWLHGGGFSSGGANIECSDGTHLSSCCDVVVVSLNHRLNIFGHLYLGDIAGDEYGDSGNVGMLDIVAALRWIRENISQFGGDPENVTIFGHSGGGSKVNVLMAMPAAAGLFHKAIQMSGPGLKMLTREQASRTASGVIERLGMRPSDLSALQTVSATKLLSAMTQVLQEADLTADGTWRNGTWFHMFDPVVDGRSLPHHPFDPPALLIARDVPMMLGTANEDSRLDPGLRASEAISLATLNDAEMRGHLVRFGFSAPEVERVIDVYRSSRPNAGTGDIFSAMASDLEYRSDAVTMAERKSALGEAGVYLYLFAWESPAFGGKYKSAHAFCMPFVFNNVDLAPGLWGQNPDPRRYELARKISRAWTTLAHSERPAAPGLPKWEPYNSLDRPTMVLNYTSELVSDPRHADRVAIESLRAGIQVNP